jgi:hypothetical protein
MKKLAALLLCASGLTAAQYQVCILVTQSGEVICGQPQSKQGADLQALAYSAVSQGQVVAWTRKVPKGKNKTKPQEAPQPPQVPTAPAQPSTN